MLSRTTVFHGSHTGDTLPTTTWSIASGRDLTTGTWSFGVGSVGLSAGVTSGEQIHHQEETGRFLIAEAKRALGHEEGNKAKMEGRALASLGIPGKAGY